MAKIRLDQLLVQQGLAPSRARAQGMIMAGEVMVDGQRITKAGAKYEQDVEIILQGQDLPFVSRGGLKLAKALDEFAIDVQDKIVLDIGASTGGFTDCLLQRGAKQVYAVDVGYGQLAWKLRCDPRVVVMERTNIRYLEADQLDPKPHLATIDVSFISITKFLERLSSLLRPQGSIVALIKPQFEAGRELVGKKGVVRDREVHEKVLTHLMLAAQEHGWSTVNLTYSPITGPEGNIEFLIHWQQGKVPWEGPVAPVVAAAHEALVKGE
ncbi:MAG: TlyA family RNA methyltransferase [Limnochordia bacterium]